MAGSLPRKAHQGLELRWAPSVPQPPLHLLVAPSACLHSPFSCSSFHSLGLFHTPILSIPLPWVSCIHPAGSSCTAQLQGAPFPQKLSVSRPFSDFISVLVCLLCPLSYQVSPSLFPPQSLVFLLWLCAYM